MGANPEIPPLVAVSEYGPGDDGHLSEWASTITADGFTDGEPGMATDDELDENASGGQGGPRNSLRNRSSETALRSQLPCPFRKRNPARFNVRDHHICSKTFADFTKLKRHITDHHKRKDADQVRREAEPRNPEDGITMAIEKRLRTKKPHLKVNTWAGLWGVLFRYDKQIPSAGPCVPMEQVEITDGYDEARCMWKQDPTTFKQVLDMLSNNRPLYDTARRIITWTDSTGKKLLDESLEAFNITALEGPAAGPARSNRCKPSRVDRGPERLRTTPKALGPEGRELPTQRQRPVRPRAPVSAEDDTGDSFTSPSPAVYLDTSSSIHLRDRALAAPVPLPPTHTRHQRWTGMPAPATIGAGSAGVRVPAQNLIPVEHKTSVHQSWQPNNSGQHPSSTLGMHHGHGQAHTAGDYEVLHTSSAGPFNLHQGQYPLPVNPGALQQGSLEYTSHPGDFYTPAGFEGWQGAGGDSRGQGEE